MALQRVRSNMLANNFTLDDDQGLIVGSGNNIYIDTVNNRVGINTNSPTHDFTVSGNIYVSGNITAGGDIQLGDSDTDTITISAEIGSDILPNIDNTYDLGSASKVWAEVHATTFRGDGSQLTGLTSTLNDVLVNGNTTALNIVSTGDITATNFIGDGSQLTGLASTLNDILGNGNTTALNIVSTGDITAANFIGDGSQLTGLASTLDEVTTNGATTTNSITVGDLIVNSTNAIGLPVGTTAQRPTAANGLMRFNSTLLEFEGYNGTEWGALGGGGATYSTSAPTVNLSEGDLWFDTGTTGELYVYSGTEWLSVTGAGGTAFYQRSFTGDNTTTVFNVYGTGSGTVLVYINGIFVTSPDDYSYSSGSVTFVTAPALNDEINVLVYGSTTGISLDINSLTDVSAASPSTGQVLKWTGTSWTPQADNSPTGDANRIVYDLSDPNNSVVLTSGGAATPATYRGDVVDNNGTVIVDVSSTNTTFTGGLLGNTYGDVYNPTGANKILESGTGNLDSVLTVDTANATTLNATTTNISGIATFTGSSVDFTGTTTMGSWNGPVYDRTGGTLIIEDNATPKPIVHADLDGDVTGTVSSISNHTTTDLTEGTNLYYTDTRVSSYLTNNDYDTATNIIAAITDSAPSTLDTLNELAAALGDDPNFATTTASNIADKLSLAGGTMTGDLDVGGTLTTNRLKVEDNGSADPIVVIRADDNSPWALNIGNDSYDSYEKVGHLFYQGSDGDTYYQSRGSGEYVDFKFQQNDGSTSRTQITIDAVGDVVLASDYYLFWGVDGSDRPGLLGDNTNKVLQFHNNGSERMRIDSSGNVGIGTDLPAHKLHIADATTPEIIVEDTTNNVKAVLGADNSVGRIGTDTNHPVTFRTNDTERMRISTAGHVTMPYQPSFRAGRNGNYVAGNNNDIVFNLTSGTQLFNTGGHYSTSTGLFTAPVAGSYMFHAVVIWGPGVPEGTDMADSFRFVYNGTKFHYSERRAEYVNGSTGNGGYYVDHGTCIVKMNANDTIGVRSQETIGVHGNSQYTTFQGQLLG